MPKRITTRQTSVLIDVLIEWASDKHEVLRKAFNYDLTRAQAWELFTQVNNVALILRDLGVENAVEEYGFNLQQFEQIVNNLD